MDGQNFDPKFGTQASVIKPAEIKPAVANPRDTFIQGLIDKQIKEEEEAEKLGIPPDQRRRHFRIDGAKSNYAPTQEAE